MTPSQSQSGLAVPADAIRMTSAFLRSVKGMESCCFWLGKREPSGAATVEAIIVPRQQNHPGHYHVDAAAMLCVADVARPRRWTNLAQVHSHPGAGVRHSGYDDEMANSRRALSLIYPHYGSVTRMWTFRGWLWGLWPSPFPREVGVHAFIQSRWTLIDQPDLDKALRLISGSKPAFFDLRS